MKWFTRRLQLLACIALAFLPLTLPLATMPLVQGCAGLSTRAKIVTTLDSAQAVAFEALNTYGAAKRAGKITPETRAKVDLAYRKYQIAYEAALTAAQFDTAKATPDNVKALLNELLAIVAQLQK